MSEKLKESLSGHFGKTLWAQLFFLMSFLPYVSQHPALVHLICFIALALGGVLAWRRQRLGFLWQIIAVFIGGQVVFEHYSTFRGLGPGLSLLAFLVCIKMVELRSERDLFIFFFISSTLLVGHLLNIYSFLGLLHFLICIGVMLLMMMCFHRKKNWIWPNRDHFKVLSVLYLLAIPQALFLFIFFPRFYVGHLKFPSVGAQSKLGFTDKLRPGDFSSIVQDQSPVFRVQFHSKQRPNRSDFYWRGAVLQQTDGFNWDRGKAPVFESFLEHYEKQTRDLDYTSYQIDFAISESDVAFTLAQTYQLEGRSRARRSFKHGEILSLRPRSSQNISYQAQALIQKTKAFQYDKLALRPYLEVPDQISPRLINYAGELKQDYPRPKQMVEELMRRYREQDFTYTLSPGIYSGSQAMQDFFFERRRGFCEHYASASALILRLAGIPSRVVTGFQGGLYNEFGDYFIVRGQDAHAWIEVYLEDEGWIRYDPVRYIAPERIELGAFQYFRGLNSQSGRFDQGQAQNFEGTFWQKARLRWDAWYYGLNQFFMSYDQNSQETFLSRLGLPKLSPPQLLGLSFGLLFLFALGGLALFSWNKKVLSEEQKLWRQFFKILEKRGLHRLAQEAPLALEQRIYRELSFKDEEEKIQISEVFTQLLELSYAQGHNKESQRIKRVRQQLKWLK